jgi:hypothetical protein
VFTKPAQAGFVCIAATSVAGDLRIQAESRCAELTGITLCAGIQTELI